MKTRPANLKLIFLPEYCEDSIAEELQRISRVTGHSSVTKAAFTQYGRLSYSVVVKKFGSLRSALEYPGLEVSRYTKPTDQQLFETLIELWERTLREEGRQPQRKDVQGYGLKIFGDTNYRRFGSWNRALYAAYEWASIGEEPIDEKSIVDRSTPSKPTASLSLRMRFFVMKRDEFRCRLCGAHGPGIRLEVDHKTSRAQGGSDHLDNLWALCFDCNRGKRDTPL